MSETRMIPSTLLLRGKTYPHRDTIRARGGRWDASASAWRVPAPAWRDLHELVSGDAEKRAARRAEMKTAREAYQSVEDADQEIITALARFSVRSTTPHVLVDVDHALDAVEPAHLWVDGPGLSRPRLLGSCVCYRHRDEGGRRIASARVPRLPRPYVGELRYEWRSVRTSLEIEPCPGDLS